LGGGLRLGEEGGGLLVGVGAVDARRVGVYALGLELLALVDADVKDLLATVRHGLPSATSQARGRTQFSARSDADW
jgi:hypothetical protein